MRNEGKLCPYKALILLLSLLSPLISSSFFVIPVFAADTLNIDYNYIREQIDMVAIKNHIEFFSSLGSRMTGYPGCDAAAEYIFNFFKEIGLQDVHYQYYNVTVPIDYGAEINVLSPQKINVTAYSLMPNSVQTCSTKGMTGRLIYARKGELKDFNGLPVNGSIVLMDFDSADNWLNAAKLGAKAVIFIEPEIGNRFEAMQKIYDIPLYFPRLYVLRNDGNKLLSLIQSGQEVIVHIKSKMKYEIRTARNIIGLINGTESPYFYKWKPEWAAEMDFSTTFAAEYANAGPGYYSKDAIAISAHYDSFSYIPSLAPGANEATGIATLLELAKYFSVNKPRRTIMFIAFSGHWQALEGVRQYVKNYWLSLPGIRAHFNLDFSTDNDRLGLVFAGHWGKILCIGFPPWGEQPLYRAAYIRDAIFKRYLPAIEKQLNKRYIMDDAVSLEWEKYVPVPYIVDIEPIMLAGTCAVSFYTTQTARPIMGTPFDTLDRVNYVNLRPQVELSFFLLASFANEPREFIPVYEVRRWREMGGFSTLEGRVVEYNFSAAWYQPVPNALVDIRLFSSPVMSAGAGGVIGTTPTTVSFMQHIVVMTDADGMFNYTGCVGLAPSGAQTAYGGMYTYSYAVMPYVIDQETGELLMAPDFGVYGMGRFGSMFVTVDMELKRNTFVVFKCASLVAFDIFDVRSFEVERNRVYLLDFRGHEIPLQFGLVFLPGKPHAMFFMEPGMPVEILVEDSVAQLVMLLNNASDKHPEGAGYAANKIGQTVVIRNTASEAVKSLQFLIKERLSLSLKYGVSNPEAVEFYERAIRVYEEHIKALQDCKYDAAYGLALTALQDLIRAYRALRGTMGDSSFTTFIFFLMLMPFTFFCERLIFEFRGIKRLLAIIAIFVIFLLTLYLFHPGFHIALNPWALIIGAAMTSLSVLPVTFIVSYVTDFLLTIRKKIVGVHFAEISRISAAFMALSIGISHMRKRKLQTTLLLITLTLITTSFVALTSSSIVLYVRGIEIPGVPSYEGLFIRRLIWEALPWQSIEYIKGILPQAIVAPRLWFYPQLQTIVLRSSSAEYAISRYAGLLALSPEERYITEIDKTLIEGSWFDENDVYSVILSYQTAQALRVKANDTVRIMGLDFIVKGIYDPFKLGMIVDLDQKSILPVDQMAGTEGIMAGARLPASSIIIVPVRFARQIPEFNVHTIAIKIQNVSELEENTLNMALRTNFDVYLCVKDKVYNYRLGGLATTQGWQFIAFPLVICMLIVFNTVMGSIYERVKEIRVYSSLGLSPKHVAYMFLAETLVYAFISSVVGYTIGIAINTSLFTLNLLPEGFYTNSSSSYLMYSILLLAFATIVSSIYPLRVASMAVTPSVERLWKIETEPKGDDWIIPMPFVLHEKREVKALLKFLEEYARAQSSERMTFIVEDIKIKEEEFDNFERLSLEMLVRIAPWDAGIIQDFRLSAISSKEKKEYKFEIYLHRRSGILTFWRKSNRTFIDEFRKQLLLWRALRPVDREKYFKMIS
ncbi:MAG: FtsX-like permease family protein [candidate division WOR-3 bacterium]